jgi:hypothetical protein
MTCEVFFYTMQSLQIEYQPRLMSVLHHRGLIEVIPTDLRQRVSGAYYKQCVQTK